MFLTKLKAGAVVLLASCMIASLTPLSAAPPQNPAAVAGGAGVVPSKDRLLAPDRILMYVNIYTTDPKADQKDLSCAHHISAQLAWTGTVIARDLGLRIAVIRIRLDPDRLRAHKISSEDVKKAATSRSWVRSDWIDEAIGKVFELKEHELINTLRWDKPEQFGEIILRATPDGEILRLKDVGRVELVSTLFDISSDFDGHPAATLVLKQATGSIAAEAIEGVKEKIKDLTKEFAAGLAFEVIPSENQSLIYAVIETPRGSTREYTSGKCRELRAIAKGIHEITSVTSLAGYQFRTESGASNAATCLIQWKAPSEPKLTSRQIIEKLEEKCRTMKVRLEFFEQPAVSAFVADGGFSVRVLDKTNSSNDERLGRMSETFLEDFLNRKDLASLFNFLAGNYRQYELVIDNEVARQKGVSIVNALENLAKVGGGDAQAKSKFRGLVEELSQSSVKTDRGEMVPYRLFMQLKNRLGLNEIDR